MTNQPFEVVERIDELISRIATASPSDDAAALSGELGLARLELYERDGDGEALLAGLRCLLQTIASVADHPDRTRWHFGIGLGYAERARREQALGDYHEALDWLSALYAGPADLGALRSRVAAALGELCWERYWLVRHGEGLDPQRALAETDRLLHRVAPLLARPADPDELTDVRLVVGLANLERHELSGDRASLHRGIALLASASLAELPVDDPRRCQAGSELAEALRRLSMMDDDPVALDRSITVATRTITWASQADGTAWFLLHRYAASAARRRWRARHDRADLELALSCWRVLLPAGLDPLSTREYNSLLADWVDTVGPATAPG